MKRYILIVFVCMVVTHAMGQDIVRVTKAEYERHSNRYNQTFDTTALTAIERHQTIEKYYNEILDEAEKTLYAQGALTIHAGVFKPSGTRADFIHHPEDGHSQIFFNGMMYNSIACDVFALSRDGLLAVSSLCDETFRSYFAIRSIRGWDIAGTGWQELHFTPYDFQWTPDGWLYFRGGYDYYKTRISPPTHCENTVMDDLEISQQEFLSAQSHSRRYNVDRYDRTPTAADTSAVRQYAGNDDVLFAIMLEELYLGQFGDGGPAFIEMVAGDYCCTRLLGDTTCMQACNLVLSRDNLFAGINTEWGAGAIEVPAYIYIYPYPEESRQVSAPYIYQTTSAWQPSGAVFFWGEDGWLYVEGWKWRTAQTTYHKVRLSSKVVY